MSTRAPECKPLSFFLLPFLSNHHIGQEPKKFPTVIEPLLADLESDIAAVVLSKAMTIAFIKQRMSQDEDNILKAIDRVHENKAKV